MRLNEKVALVVGCSPSINAGIALSLAEAGAKLVCADIQRDFSNGCAEAVRKSGGEAVATQVDVTDEAQVIEAVQLAEKTFGRIDVLVNGAVIHIRNSVLDITVADFRKQMDVILTGTLLFTKHVARSMVAAKRGGSIINISSTEGHQGSPNNIGYGTAKGGLLHFSRTAAMDLAPHGIRVNSLTPTGTDPGEGEKRAAEWGLNWVAPRHKARPGFTDGDKGIPMGRRPTTGEYGAAAVFLASDDAAMITGTDLRVDGGVAARYWRWNPGVNEFA